MITMNRIYIIAEAGVNHNGNIKLAYQLIDAAKEAGADAVKFQTFRAESLVSKSAEKAEYQKQTTQAEESQFEMLKKLELSIDDLKKLKVYSDKSGIQLLSTPFDVKSILLLNELDLPALKIPSGEVTNLPYLEKIAQTGSDIIMSTGMCDMSEVETAVNVLRDHGAGRIVLLHCNTEYPTPFGDVNLRAMLAMKEYFQLETGYSDHTQGIEVPIAAAALGASVIEKHFTLDCTMEGPDHKASLEPHELKSMINAIRNIELALGDGVKGVTESEKNNLGIVRKSIVASRKIYRDEQFTDENLTTKRPGSGISPMKWHEVIGKCAKKDFEEDELIEI